jgi:hypothetical protein
MKKLVLGISLLTSLIASANSGGPDAFGYTWKDSNEPGGPTYQWFDITSIGTMVNGLGDDNFIGPIQIGFQFPYYWYTESKVWVGSNGYVEFGPGNLAANFPVIPTASGVNNYIGGIIADLTFLGPNNNGQCYYYASQDTFCIEYLNVPFWDPNSPGYNGANTFEIILNKADSSITVNFMSFTGTSVSNFSTGIENSIGTMGLQPFMSLPPQQNYTLKYYYPSNIMQVTDASVSWNHQDGDGGIFLGNLSGAHPLVTQIENSGNTSIGPVIVYGRVVTLNNTTLVTTSDTTPSLVPNQSAQVTYPNSFTPSTNGTREFITRISGVSGDAIPVNDSIVQEIVVVDTTAQSVRLCYTNNHLDMVSSSISWGGGSGGVGVYIKPPSYPAMIVNTNYIMTSAPTSGVAFYAKIYDDNGPGGSAGTLLDSVAVFANQVTLNGITVIPVATPNLIINSGGFYVNWDMANASSSIAQSFTPPFSRQTYEVFQNYWSNFRDYQICDFFIGADVNYTFVNVPEHHSLQQVSVYPVPCGHQENFSFAAETNDAVVITVTDLTGKTIEVKKFPPAMAGTVLTLDLSNYAEGTYIYTIQSGKEFSTGKLIKE